MRFLPRLFVFLALLWGGAAQAAVAFYAVFCKNLSGCGGTTLTWEHTPVGTPSAVGVTLQNYQGATSVTGVSYGASAMTQAVAITDGNNNSAQVWGLANPPSGAQTVTVTFAATGAFAEAGSFTVTGSDTTTTFSNSNSASGSSTAPSESITSASGEFVIDVLSALTSNGTITQGGSQTLRWQLDAPGNRGGGSSAPASVGSTTMSWTM